MLAHCKLAAPLEGAIQNGTVTYRIPIDERDRSRCSGQRDGEVLDNFGNYLLRKWVEHVDHVVAIEIHEVSGVTLDHVYIAQPQ